MTVAIPENPANHTTATRDERPCPTRLVAPEETDSMLDDVVVVRIALGSGRSRLVPIPRHRLAELLWS
ncbi:MAG: hypothetical protein AAFX99_18735 [Myxococcota bacterium]